MLLKTFGLGAYDTHDAEIPIYLSKGVGKASLLGGFAIKAGGKYGFQECSYNFQTKSIVDKEIFDAAIAGKRITYVNTL